MNSSDQMCRNITIFFINYNNLTKKNSVKPEVLLFGHSYRMVGNTCHECVIGTSPPKRYSLWGEELTDPNRGTIQVRHWILNIAECECQSVAGIM